MATYTNVAVLTGDTNWGDIDGTIASISSSLVIIINTDGTRTYLFGSGFTGASGVLTGGTITAMGRTRDGGATFFEQITGISFSAITFSNQLASDPNFLGIFANIFKADDIFIGGTVGEVLHGFDGADSLVGGAGADTITGGAGNDTQEGGAGDDVFVIGNLLADHPSGPTGEVIDGGDDFDTLRFTATGDFALTLSDNITGVELIEISDIAGDNSGTNNASILGFRVGGAYTLQGNNGDNRLVSGLGDQTILGGDGADRIDGGEGADDLRGEGGDDTFVIDGLAVSIAHPANETIDGGSGTDTLRLGPRSIPQVVSVSANVSSIEVFEIADYDDGPTTLSGGIDASAVAGPYTMQGSLGDDTLIAGSGGNTIDGGDGADSLVGGAGADTITGGAGNDTQEGGAGDDVFVIGNLLADHPSGPTGEVIDGGDDFDTLRFTATGDFALTLSDNITGVELIEISDIAGDNSGTNNASILGFRVGGAYTLQGNNGDNRLVSGLGDQTILGGDGADRIDGGEGADDLRGEGGDDTFVIDGLAVSIAHPANETIDGGSGTDTLRLAPHLIPQVLSVSANVSSIEIFEIADYFGAPTALSGGIDASAVAGPYTMQGSLGDDTLIAGSGGNTIDGGDGNDTLTGGAGADTLLGFSGDDTFHFSFADTAAGEVIDGGTHTTGDTLLIDGGGAVSLVGVTVTDIEDIQLTDAAGTTLTVQDAAQAALISSAAGASDRVHIGSSTVVTEALVKQLILDAGVETVTWSIPGFASAVEAVPDGLGGFIISYDDGDDLKPWDTIDAQYDSLGRKVAQTNDYDFPGPEGGITSNYTFDPATGFATTIVHTDGHLQRTFSTITTTLENGVVTKVDTINDNNTASNADDTLVEQFFTAGVITLERTTDTSSGNAGKPWLYIDREYEGGVTQIFRTFWDAGVNGGGQQVVGTAGSQVIEGVVAGGGVSTTNDALVGGAGADTFRFVPGFGHDTIYDFADGTDLLDLSSYAAGIETLSELQNAASIREVAFGASFNTVIDFNASDDQITIRNFLIAQLDNTDFVV